MNMFTIFLSLVLLLRSKGVRNMSKEAENTISFIREIKKQAYKVFAEKLEDKLRYNCRIVKGDSYLQGYYRADVHKCIDEILEDIK